jgi:D-aspartate ligase
MLLNSISEISKIQSIRHRGVSIPGMKGKGSKLTARPVYILKTHAIGLGAARSLSNKNVPVIAIDYLKDAVNHRSKSYFAYHRIPDIEESPDAAVEALVRCQQEQRHRGILLPCSDAFILFMSRQRKDLTKHFDFILPSEEVLELIMNKKSQYKKAAELGVPIPETHYPTCLDDLDQFKDHMRYPLLIKPCYSHLWQQKFPNKGFQVTNPKELKRRFQTTLDAEVEVIVQEVVPGPNTNLRGIRAYIDKNGKAHGVLESEKIRQYPVDFGIGCLNQTSHNKIIAMQGLALMKGIDYRGIGAVEFKKDERDGVFRLMELNARIGKTIWLSTKAGLNLPWMMYQDVVGMPIDDDVDYTDGIRWHDFIMDSGAYQTLKARNEITFKEWMRTSIGSDCHPFFAWNDLMPSLIETNYGVDVVHEIANLVIFSVRKSRNQP